MFSCRAHCPKLQAQDYMQGSGLVEEVALCVTSTPKRRRMLPTEGTQTHEKTRNRRLLQGFTGCFSLFWCRGIALKVGETVSACPRQALPLPSKDSYFKAFGPKDPIIKGFWAILMPRVRAYILNPRA